MESLVKNEGGQILLRQDFIVILYPAVKWAIVIPKPQKMFQKISSSVHPETLLLEIIVTISIIMT